MRARTTVAVFVLCLGAAAFYWYSWRPMRIRSGCSHSAMLELIEVYPRHGVSTEEEVFAARSQFYKALYERCVHDHGLGN